MLRPPPISTRPDPLVPYTTLFRSVLRRPEPQQYIGALDRRLRPVDPDRLDRIGTLPTNPSRIRKAHRDPVERERGFDHIAGRPGHRSEERRVGKEWGSTGRY